MIVAIIGAVILALSYYLNIYPVVFVLLTMLFIHIYKSEANKPSKQSVVAVFVFVLVHNAWLLSLAEFEGAIKASFIYLSSVLYFSFIISILLFVIYFLKNLKLSYLLISVVWVIFERLLATGPLGYPLYSLYLTQAYALYLPFAGIVGGYGLSFFCVVCSILLARLYLNYRNFPYRMYLIFLILLILLVVIIIGVSRSDNTPLRYLKTAILQPNISQQHKQKNILINGQIDYYISLIKEVREEQENLELIILPEVIVTDFLEERILTLLNDSGVIGNELLMFGLPIKRNNLLLNGILFYSKGEIVNYYAKTKLVPFAEKESKFLSFFHPDGQRYFDEGKYNKPLSIQGVAYGTTICFESMFPQLYKSLAKSNLLIVLTDDSWFSTSFKELHLRSAIFRAAENKRYMLFVNNTGVSAVINAKGKIVQKLSANKPGYIIFEVPIY